MRIATVEHMLVSRFHSAVVFIGTLLLISSAASPRADEARPDLSGTWMLDTYLSDSPAQIARALELDTGLQSWAFFAGQGGRASGLGRGGVGELDADGQPSETPAKPEPKDPLKPEDRKKLKDLINAVQFPSLTLAITQTVDRVTLAGTRGTEVLLTNGKDEKQTRDAVAVTRTARWEGPLLLVSYDAGRPGVLTFAYSLVPTTGQLMIRVNFERTPGQPGPFEIRLVYGRPPPKER
jgi:hypothetical protein